MKEKIVSFCWQHLLLLLSLFVMTVGVAVCVRSMLGSSVISVLPYVFASAGEHALVPALTIGQYTYIMNFVLVLGIAACYLFFGAWQWHIVGIGTLFAMFYVGIVVRLTGRHLGWFDRLLAYRPGFRRYIYGLARFIYNGKPAE